MKYCYIVPIYIVLHEADQTTDNIKLQVASTVGHWIVLSTIDCANHEVKIYDSL